ncbi:MAG TPA: Wzz/FepE/Etk N-terminal domain-containing protein [Candidatus Limnocylindrales bacterium]|nr:Wzz/FepE/Etk N-terminal domain-containing protein [Candidatus Limnocylindrales bacterium]
MEIGDYLSIAKRWWWTLLVAIWVAALAGYLVASRLPPTYESEVVLLVGPISNSDVNTLKASGELVQTYATLVTSQPVMSATIEKLGLTMSTQELESNTSALANDVTRFLTIDVDDSDPREAARIANGVAGELIALTSQGTVRPEGQLQIIDPAEPPGAPIAPQVGLIVMLAAVAGLLGAIVVILLAEYFSETIRTREDLVRHAPVPVLTTLGGARSGFGASTGTLAVEAAPTSRLAASLRLLSAKIAYVDGTRQARTILIAACQPGDNVAEVAASVASSMAQSGRAVTLVDASPTAPSATELLGLQGQPGLSEALATGASLARYQGSRMTDLPVVPRGVEAMPDDIEAETARRILDALQTEGGVTIIAGGAISSSAASLTLARLADVTVLVVDRDRTRRDNVSYAVETLRLVKANLVGTVLSLRHAPQAARRVGPSRVLATSGGRLSAAPGRRPAPDASTPGASTSPPDVGAGRQR